MRSYSKELKVITDEKFQLEGPLVVHQISLELPHFFLILAFSINSREF